MSETLRVLVVEDNAADADFIREMLPEAGPAKFHIESVVRLSEALARLERGGIDLVLLDLGLPDSQGLTTFHTLRNAAPGVSVIVLSGTDDHELAVAAVRDGAQDYFVKGQVGGNLLTRAALYALERQRAAAKIAEQLEELRRWHDAMLGRETRVLELKKEVNVLLAQLGQPPRYPSALEGREP